MYVHYIYVHTHIHPKPCGDEEDGRIGLSS